MKYRSCADRKTAFFLLLALLCLTGPGISRGETSRATVFTDDAGRRTRLAHSPARMVSLVPAVIALVTAGVHGNAMRASRDAGSFYEPGTINILLPTSARLTWRAMTRAVITATEAKTAALQDLDIRSSYHPRRFVATGTGTDNNIVVQSAGVTIDNAGGHTRMGELIAAAVHDAVVAAVFHQNGLGITRKIFQRLQERRIGVHDLVRPAACDGATGDIAQELETALLDPANAAFVEAALSLSDAQQAGRHPCRPPWVIRRHLDA